MPRHRQDDLSQRELPRLRTSATSGLSSHPLLTSTSMCDARCGAPTARGMSASYASGAPRSATRARQLPSKASVCVITHGDTARRRRRICIASVICRRAHSYRAAAHGFSRTTALPIRTEVSPILKPRTGIVDHRQHTPTDCSYKKERDPYANARRAHSHSAPFALPNDDGVPTHVEQARVSAPAATKEGPALRAQPDHMCAAR